MEDKLQECVNCYKNQDYDLLLKYLKEVIHGLMNEPFRICTWHPFGFLKVNLGSVRFDGEKANLQVNMWLPNLRYEQDIPSICHDHNSDLYSIILTGNIVNTNYYINFDDNEGLYSIYKVIYKEHTSISKLFKRGVGCTYNNVNLYDKGKRYMIKQGEFHSSFVPIGLYTCTFVIRTKFNQNADTFNIRLNNEIDEYVFDRNPITNDKAILLALNKFLTI